MMHNIWCSRWSFTPVSKHVSTLLPQMFCPHPILLCISDLVLCCFHVIFHSLILFALFYSMLCEFLCQLGCATDTRCSCSLECFICFKISIYIVCFLPPKPGSTHLVLYVMPISEIYILFSFLLLHINCSYPSPPTFLALKVLLSSIFGVILSHIILLLFLCLLFTCPLLWQYTPGPKVFYI
jgi:hypothetical protein